MNKFSSIISTIAFKNINKFTKTNKIIFYKNNNYNNIKINYSPALLKNNNVNDIEEFTNKIKKFLLVMTKNCKNFNPKVFIENFEETYFEIRKTNKKIINDLDSYVCHGTNIRFVLNTFDDIYHELLHLASIIKQNNYDQLIYEGYTQVLAERYFNENIGNAYFIETLMAKCVESILGQDIMERIYFKGDFYLIYSLLENYIGTSKLTRFFNFLKIYVNSVKNNDYATDEQILAIKNMFDILVIGLINKLSNTNDINEINIDELSEIWCRKIICSKFDNEDSFDTIPLEKFQNLFNNKTKKLQ